MSKLKPPKNTDVKKRVKERLPKVITEKGIFSKKLRKRGPRRKKRKTVSGNKRLGTPQKKNEEFIKREQIKEAVQALLLLIEKTTTADNQLFGDDPQPILMQVAAAKVPKVPSKRMRCKLPYPLVTDTSDVCLIVDNRPKKFKGDVDRITEHHKERLTKRGITQITQIITLKQLLTEYSQFEQKRRLCQQFDVFLTDARIGDRVAKHFGKFLKFSPKTAIPVCLRADNLKENIERALSKTTMQIHGKGDSFIVQVGHTKQQVEMVVENVCTVAAALSREFPGGWENVSTVYIKTTDSLAIPVYVSLKSPNDVPVPLVKSKRPKKAVPVEGELSTRLGYVAKVYPGGKVELKKDKKTDSDIEWSDDEQEEEEELHSNKASTKLAKEKRQLDEDEPQNKARKKARKDEADAEVKEEDQLEERVVDAEESYLKQWEKERDEDVKENEKKIKGEVSKQPQRKKVRYTVGEMSLGDLRNETTKKHKKSGSGGIVHTAFKELKSKISKKMAKKQKATAGAKSVICSSKSSGKQKKRNARGKNKSKSPK